MFKYIRVMHKSKNCKLIDINNYHPIDLNVIVEFYENHDDYSIEYIG